MRHIRQKFLSHYLESLSSCDIEKYSERTGSTVSIGKQRHNSQIEYLTFWTMSLDFNTGPFLALQRIEKRAIDRWIACQFCQSLRFKLRNSWVKEPGGDGIRSNHPHVSVNN